MTQNIAKGTVFIKVNGDSNVVQIWFKTEQNNDIFLTELLFEQIEIYEFVREEVLNSDGWKEFNAKR